MAKKPLPPQAWTEHFPDEQFATEWAMGWLRTHGYLVAVDPNVRPMVTPKELRQRIAPAMPSSTFCQRLWRGGCPQFQGEFGPGGRLLRLRPSGPLEDWLARPIDSRGGRLNSRLPSLIQQPTLEETLP